MNPILKNILAVIAGVIVGMLVNMFLVSISGLVIPLPEGVNPNDPNSLVNNIHRFGVQHFIFPFLAHALGTLTGAFTAAKIAATHQMKFALGIGVFFLMGGIAASTMIPAPTWFMVLDIVGAYLPMGWLGGYLVTKNITT